MPIDINTLTPQEQISSIYISYYNRAPDPLGLEFWTGQLDSGLSLEEIATTFSSAAETIGQFPFFDPDAAATSPDAFLTSVYQNLFGRDPDAEGLTFWGDQLASGSTPVGEILLAIAEGAQDVAGGTQDLSTLTNKIDVAADWAASAAAADIGTTEGSAIAVDNGDGTFTVNVRDAFTSASTILDDVTEDPTTVTAATDATDAFIADGTVPDDGTGDAPDDGTGDVPDDGTGDVPDDVVGDTFAITADAAEADEGGTATFTVAAAEGAETLTEGTEVPFTLSGVDAADVDGDLTGTATVGATGEATITVTLVEDATTEGAEALTVTLDDGASTSVTVNDTSVEPVVVPGDTLTLTTDDDTLAGTVDSDTFNAQAGTLNDGDTLDGDDGNDTLNATVLGANALNPTIVGIETINLNSRGVTNSIDLASTDGIETISVRGGADTTLQSLTGGRGIDHNLESGFEGDFTAEFTDGGLEDTDDALSVTLNGASEQTITLNADDTSGGDAETLEDLNVTSSGAANAITLAANGALNGIDDITIDGDQDLTIATTTAGFGLVNNGVDASGLGGALTFDIDTDTGGGTIDTTVVDGLDNLVVRDSDDTTPQALTLSVDDGVGIEIVNSAGTVGLTQTGATSAGSLSDSQSITVGGGADVDIDAVTTNGIETVNLTSTTTDTETPDDRANSVESVDGTSTQVLNIDGDADLTLDDVLDANNLQVLDASGFTGALTMAANNNTSQMVIDGGSQADTLLGFSADDAITGNGGDDDITGGAGADEMTGGAGADTFFFNDGDATGGDVITDFADGTDLIDLDGTFNGATTSTDIVFADLTVAAIDTTSDGNDDAVEISYTDDTGASTITLQGITDTTSITADDFNFA